MFFLLFFCYRCFKLLPTAPLMTIQNFRFEILPNSELKISLSAREQQQLAWVTRGMAGGPSVRRLGLVFKGKILHVPKVRSELKTDSIKVSFCDKTILENFRELEKQR